MLYNYHLKFFIPNDFIDATKLERISFLMSSINKLFSHYTIKRNKTNKEVVYDLNVLNDHIDELELLITPIVDYRAEYRNLLNVKDRLKKLYGTDYLENKRESVSDLNNLLFDTLTLFGSTEGIDFKPKKEGNENKKRSHINVNLHYKNKMITYKTNKGHIGSWASINHLTEADVTRFDYIKEIESKGKENKLSIESRIVQGEDPDISIVLNDKYVAKIEEPIELDNRGILEFSKMPKLFSLEELYEKKKSEITAGDFFTGSGLATKYTNEIVDFIYENKKTKSYNKKTLLLYSINMVHLNLGIRDFKIPEGKELLEFIETNFLPISSVYFHILDVMERTRSTGREITKEMILLNIKSDVYSFLGNYVYDMKN